jgi:hypothetical protein
MFIDRLRIEIHVPGRIMNVPQTKVTIGEAADGVEERAALGLDTVVLLDCHHDYGFRLEDCRIDDRWLYPSRFGQSKERWRQVLSCRHFEDWEEGANAPRRAALTLTLHRYR